ncbi:MAG TPA: multifunctional oxoglutarate decarboxylase/oxoglutarate dehydrogenase thiamine pyrophosphate-binding subunit/dihydrolipoyllysine-residue succinyltransferase subunit [Actinomycetes bacterium]|nr:multifunctional oxoglutarate decarboxylase/oxoglutarate dehydrogenase thiamine pyrophosphate-binding subunit/dihydrolipoyllysine-residue succinyltransferase subunit [Actinomycetes bacterium]
MSTQPNQEFGPNQWLVDELYQQYLTDPGSVDPAWHGFFEDYRPSEAAPATARAAAPPVDTSAVRVEPAPPPALVPSATPPTPSTPTSQPAAPRPPAASQDTQVLRGPAARVVTNMEASLAVPTATSVRGVPAKLLIDNRIVVNNHLKRSRGGKISFTHIIAWAVIRALKAMPELNASYAEVDGKPVVVKPEHVNLGLAIDLQKPDGTRQLVVPSVKAAEDMDFTQFWAAYEDVVRRARGGKLTADDFAGTTISLTNPGTIGTVHSVPRLMQGQGAIVGVGALEYPAEYQGASSETLARLAVSKILTLTSTYDHRIIQGAQSGDFLRRIHAMLLGEDDFYDGIFSAMRIPYEPIRWVQDITASHDDDVNKTARVQELIHAYRVRGHLMADTNPLEYKQRRHPDLDLVNHGLTMWDLDREFATGGFGGKPLMMLREILGVLRDSYARTTGIEYMHIQDPEQRQWIQARFERGHERPGREEQLHILRRLNAAEAFETFLQTKFVGQKRFSLEGSESVIPLLDEILASAAQSGLHEVTIGMPHRGRLNVLANIVGKSYGQIFREFEGNLDVEAVQGSGDVKYHLGAEGTFKAPDGSKIAVTLVSNPSHLEAVSPVLEGSARAKQDLLGLGESGFTVLPLLLHGDAAFSGQGVVAETLELSQLRGYRTGGTVHVVVNNQVGFTTAPAAARSSVYATDVARAVQAPIFHVNGDDPEAVLRVAHAAFEFRQAFKKDVVIDLLCYRRRGHNEADDPSLTQPLMYNLIDAKRSVRKLYTEALIGRGDISVEEAEAALRDYQEQLEKVFTESRAAVERPDEAEPATEVEQRGEVTLAPQTPERDVETAVTRDVIDRVVATQLNLPEGFTVHPRLAPQLQRRAEMVQNGTIDWAFAETLAIGSLLTNGVSVRLAGQDSRRGTFGQRHMVIIDRVTGWAFKPLKRCYENGAKLYVYDSPLSEFAAVGFEYGYSVARPEALVLWEAQFGDFTNGAQTIVDEFISSGEQKWGQRSSVVMLLPHGYEGQGPDHSSARIERFMQLGAQDNMTIANLTTPANYFHLLRWQALSPVRRPLVVFTPKSMLRLKAAASGVDALTQGHFNPVFPDETVEPERVRKVLLSSGKVYYDLAKYRADNNITDTALVRVERLYPLATNEIFRAVARYGSVELRWVQEEPANQGAWPFMGLSLVEALGQPLKRISRAASSAAATGSAHAHEREQRELVAEAFAD